MGRYDALTQLDESQQPEKELENGQVVPRKKHSPPPPSKQPLRQEATPEVTQKESPVPHAEANNRPVRPRHAFDIYQDQYEALLELSLEERRQGGTGSMSAMVREALDKFITDRKKK